MRFENNYEAGHIHARSRGGETTVNNLDYQYVEHVIVQWVLNICENSRFVASRAESSRKKRYFYPKKIFGAEQNNENH